MRDELSTKVLRMPSSTEDKRSHRGDRHYNIKGNNTHHKLWLASHLSLSALYSTFTGKVVFSLPSASDFAKKELIFSFQAYVLHLGGKKKAEKFLQLSKSREQQI